MTAVNTSTNTLLNNTTASSSSSNTANDGTTVSAESSTSTGDSVTVSTRAQKLQQLSEEFFSGGLMQMKDMPALVQRLEEYGFITSNEAESIGFDSSEGSLDGELGEMSSFIDLLAEQLADDENNNGILTALDNAKSVIESFDQSQSPIAKTELNITIAEITDFLSSSRSDALAEEDKQYLEQLNTVLKISDKLQQDQLSSESINRYLSFL